MRNSERMNSEPQEPEILLLGTTYTEPENTALNNSNLLSQESVKNTEQNTIISETCADKAQQA